MKEITDVEELHEILLDIAKAFHEICVSSQIPYYMLGGTMLGAVRHQGFIPWDDDMDFGIPRPYFCKAVKVLREKLPSNLSIYTIDDYATTTGIIKIADNRTTQNAILAQNKDANIGINIDVFPLDYAFSPTNPGRLINMMITIQRYRLLKSSFRSLSKKCIALLAKFLLFFSSRRFIIDIIEKYMLPTSGDYIANYYGAWGQKETVKKEFMGTPILYKFESAEFYGVEKADSYLTALYKNYMQLPPKEKRHLHIKNMYWK